MIILEAEDPQLFARIEENNLMRQYDLLTNCIEIGLALGPRAFDKSMLLALNHAAVANISHLGGRYRQEPMYVGSHIPPHFKDVGELMEQFFANVHESWYSSTPTQLAAYGLWRLNWIHPFVEGNERTARAVCYYLLCVRNGGLMPGHKTVPERIREERAPYYAALQAADRGWADGHYRLSELEHYLIGLQEAQLRDDP